MKRSSQAGLLCAVLTAVLGLASSVQAATITVTSPADDGTGSLRQAIATAVSGDEISFDPTMAGVPVQLTSGQIVIDKDLTITGLGRNATSIVIAALPPQDYPNRNRILNIVPGVSVGIDSLTLSDDWYGYDVPEGGGAILNKGNLTVINSVVTGASRTAGGAITNEGDLNLINTKVTGSAEHSGGALVNGGRVQISRCEIRGWVDFGGFGGAVFNGGNMTADDSVFHGSSAAFGGAIGNAITATLHLTRCLIAGNFVRRDAPALQNYGSMIVRESTIAGNSGPFTNTTGGGIWNIGDAIVINSTIYGNQVNSSGGGVLNLGRLELDSSTVSGNIVELLGRKAGIANETDLWAGQSGVTVVKNSLIIGNHGLHFNEITCGDPLCPQSCCLPPIADNDCDGDFISEGNNLVGTLTGRENDSVLPV
ncbi:MAG: hypothetical protein L0Z52_04690, partial [Acidobacteria bacterium]|nr:hypothetical protein [Acidobacteriota bacterium]